jgi:hypothetical protein
MFIPKVSLVNGVRIDSIVPQPTEKEKKTTRIGSRSNNRRGLRVRSKSETQSRKTKNKEKRIRLRIHQISL